jgi:hypothetical protein
MKYGEADACPRCWHSMLSSTVISDYIFRGGVLDHECCCTLCDFKVPTQACPDCREQQPCPACYACIYNGTMHDHMPVEMHKLYMRNSPYQRKWSDRPRSMGEWFGSQPHKYTEVLHLVRRFTHKFEVQQHLNHLERRLTNCPVQYKHEAFWTGQYGFTNLCLLYFADRDGLSDMMRAYHRTIQHRCRFFPL